MAEGVCFPLFLCMPHSTKYITRLSPQITPSTVPGRTNHPHVFHNGIIKNVTNCAKTPRSPGTVRESRIAPKRDGGVGPFNSKHRWWLLKFDSNQTAPKVTPIVSYILTRTDL